MTGNGTHAAFQLRRKSKDGYDYATWLIKQKAEQIVHRHGFNESDRDDIEQGLAVEVLEQWPKFDANRSRPRTFIARVVRGKVCKIIRAREVQLRHVRNLSSRELDQLRPQNGQAERTHEDEADLVLDIASVIGRLPAELRDLCEHLKTKSFATITRECGLPRSTLRSRVLQLREHFKTAGLQDYL